MKNEDTEPALESLQMKQIASDDSSDWEEIESKVISVDCRAVNVLVQALRQPVSSTAKTAVDKKAAYLQTFQPGQPPVVNLNEHLVDRLFG